MTVEEAIEILEELASELWRDKYKMAMKTAIKALEEIQLYKENKLCLVQEDAYSRQCCELDAYKEIGTVEECREAVERQKPKKPKEILRHRGGFKMHHCPNCDTHYQTDNRYTIKDNYCPVCRKLLDSAFRKYCGNCGQAIAENLEGMEDERD